MCVRCAVALQLRLLLLQMMLVNTDGAATTFCECEEILRVKMAGKKKFESNFFAGASAILAVKRGTPEADLAWIAALSHWLSFVCATSTSRLRLQNALRVTRNSNLQSIHTDEGYQRLNLNSRVQARHWESEVKDPLFHISTRMRNAGRMSR